MKSIDELLLEGKNSENLSNDDIMSCASCKITSRNIILSEVVQENIKNFSHLHVHSKYSLLDGLIQPEQLFEKSEEYKMKGVAMTDHNHLLGFPYFSEASKNHKSIKPIYGVELYWNKSSEMIKDKEKRDEYKVDIIRNIDSLKDEIYEYENPMSKKGVPLKKKILKAKKAVEIAKRNGIKENIYTYDTKQNHLIALAKNQIGFKNLCKLQSEGSRLGTFNGRYTVDDELMEKYKEGIIFSSACVAGRIPYADTYEEAKEIAIKYKKMFGDNFYLEIQPISMLDQFNANYRLIHLSEELNIPLIATNDVHFLEKSDYDLHDTLICIGFGKMKNDKNRIRYKDSLYFMNKDEMINEFAEQYEMSVALQTEFTKKEYIEICAKAMYNTGDIVDKIDNNISIGSDVDLFPKFEVKSGRSLDEELTYLSFVGLYKNLSKRNIKDKKIIKIYEKRITEELDIINKKGFSGYILTVRDYIEYANSHNCPTGPGRGSGAGSLVLFSIGVTKIIDPIQENLLFFRFLTADRTAPPDIDTDFDMSNRHVVIEYLQEKYGKEKVSAIGTISKIGVKSGIKDVMRVHGIPVSESNKICKMIEAWSKGDPYFNFKKLDEIKEEFKNTNKAEYNNMCSIEKKYKKQFSEAKQLEGTPRNLSVHASGVLVTPDPITDLFPMRYDKTGKAISLYSGNVLESLKAIKFDILGLKCISIIREIVNSCELLKKDKSGVIETFDDLYDIIDIEDPKIYETISDASPGAADALFQIESNLFHGVIKEMQPSNFGDIVSLTSLCRPGPLSANMDKAYTKRKNGEEEAVEPLKGTWYCTKDTYGTICYQEQLMLIAKTVALFDDNQSDTYLRKAFAKKKKDKMRLCRQWFIYGKTDGECKNKNNNGINDEDSAMYDTTHKYGANILGGINNGYIEQDLIDFWENIKQYADYLFNKSHAACYSYITVITAFLKTYALLDFWKSVLIVKPEKLVSYVGTIRGNDIKIAVPNINTSIGEYTLNRDDNSILMGFESIKGVKKAAKVLNDNAPYDSIEEVMEKNGTKIFDKTVGINTIQAGAFDLVYPNMDRHEILEEYFKIRGEKITAKTTDKDKAIFESFKRKMTKKDKIIYERDLFGCCVSVKSDWDILKINKSTELDNSKIISVKYHNQSNGKKMAFVKVENLGAEIEVLVFANSFSKHKKSLLVGNYINFNCKKIEPQKCILNEITKTLKPEEYEKDTENRLMRDAQIEKNQNVKQIDFDIFTQ